MKIERLHGTTKQTAIQKIDQFLDDLMKRRFEEVEISNPRKEWNGNVMEFSFHVSKGMKYTNIRGNVTVTETSVRLEAKMGIIARQFVSEDLISKTINEQFEKLFFLNG